jgi:hypothetical protein
MLDADFPLYTKQCLRKEMERIKALKSQGEAIVLDEKLQALKNKFK